MVPPAPTPSARLVRAAAAERAELARHRERLLAARDRCGRSSRRSRRRCASSTSATRCSTGSPGRRRRSAAAVAPPERPRPASAGRDAAARPGDPPRRGRGPARAARIAPQALHYRDWFDALARGRLRGRRQGPARGVPHAARAARRSCAGGRRAASTSSTRPRRGGCATRLDALHAELRGIDGRAERDRRPHRDPRPARGAHGADHAGREGARGGRGRARLRRPGAVAAAG